VEDRVQTLKTEWWSLRDTALAGRRYIKGRTGNDRGFCSCRLIQGWTVLASGAQDIVHS
jgi:hypothetical protein